MPSALRFAHLPPDRRAPARTRLALAIAEARRRLRPRATYFVPLGLGDVLLSHDDFPIDRKTLEFVVRDRAWATDYADVVVLDVGAHKGYFAAYALDQGARAAISFEPEARNVELLERTASSFRARGADWTVQAVAVGAERGEADLHVMSGSWGHTLRPPDSFARYEVGVQRVQVAALADVVADASARSAGSSLVVKLNIEGAECETILGTPSEAWAAVSEVLIETHPWASCDADELARHLASAGFTRVESAHRVVLRLRRAGAPRSGSRTSPT